MNRFSRLTIWVGVAALVLSVTSVALGQRTTYDRFFVNNTTVPIAFYTFDKEAARWDFAFVVNPWERRVERDEPRRDGNTAPMARILWGADIGVNDAVTSGICEGVRIDIMKNDFGNVNFKWFIESGPEKP